MPGGQDEVGTQALPTWRLVGENGSWDDSPTWADRFTADFAFSLSPNVHPAGPRHVRMCPVAARILPGRDAALSILTGAVRTAMTGRGSAVCWSPARRWKPVVGYTAVWRRNVGDKASLRFVDGANPGSDTATTGSGAVPVVGGVRQEDGGREAHGRQRRARYQSTARD